MKQEENEDINEYESRIRAKLSLCSYNCCKCDEDCYVMKCGANREEDEILDLVLGNMKDKNLQKEIWRKGVEFDTLEKVLNVIRASEGVDHHQSNSTEAGQAVWQSDRSKGKCHNCDKPGHIAKNCKEAAKTIPRSTTR